jgi:hypothetical protein
MVTTLRNRWSRTTIRYSWRTSRRRCKVAFLVMASSVASAPKCFDGCPDYGDTGLR